MLCYTPVNKKPRRAGLFIGYQSVSLLYLTLSSIPAIYILTCPVTGSYTPYVTNGTHS